MLINENTISICAESTSKSIERNNIPASIKSKIGFADDIIWPAITVTQELINQCQVKNIHLTSSTTGIIVYGNTRPVKTEAKLANQIAASGRVSPLTFAAASAASIVSAICTGFELRGPCLNFHDERYININILKTIIFSWINAQLAEHVICLHVTQKSDVIKVAGAIWK